MQGSHFTELVAILDRLRSPDGCPWDAKQTHQSLVEYLIEEAYESVEAIDANDSAAMREELGDLLLQVVFHARIAQEQPGGWDIDAVIDGISQKLIKRHPHVFGSEKLDTANAVELTWHERKTREKNRTENLKFSYLRSLAAACCWASSSSASAAAAAVAAEVEAAAAAAEV